MKIFSTKNSVVLGQSVAKNLGIQLSETEVKKFPDTELRVRILDLVVGEEVVVISSPSGNVQDEYFELFFLLDSIKRSGADKISLVIPYLAYERQDHVFRDGECVSVDVIANFLDSFGLKQMITFDLHTIKIEEIFKTPIKHLSALPLFALEIEKLKSQDTFLVSPDMGGIRRIEILSQMTDNTPYVKIVKDRNLENGQILDAEIQGDLGKKAIIVDDICSSGKTLVAGAKILKENGVEDVKAFITHPVFAPGAQQLLVDSLIDQIIVTDSIETKPFEKLRVISIASQIAEAIRL